EEDEVDPDRKQQVEAGPGQHHQKALPQRLVEKSAPAVGGRHLVGRVLAQELDESAEWDRGDAVVGGAYTQAEKARAQAERKAQHLDPTELGDHEMPQLVNEHEPAQEQEEIARLRQIMHEPTSLADQRARRACAMRAAQRGSVRSGARSSSCSTLVRSSTPRSSACSSAPSAASC